MSETVFVRNGPALADLLRVLIENKGSDLHLQTGEDALSKASHPQELRSLARIQ